MQGKKLSRRDFLRMSALTAAGAAMASCAPEVVREVVKETVVVEATPQVVEKAVTATPPPRGKVPVRVTSSHPLPYLDPLAYDLAKERLPHIELTIDQTPFGDSWASYGDNVIIRIAGGEALDLIYMASEVMPLFAYRKVIQPLDPFIEGDPETSKEIEEDFQHEWWDVFTYKGRRMGHPLGGNVMLMWWNPKIFRELGVKEPWDGWTWDDFLETCLAVADVKGTEEDRYAYSWYDEAFGIGNWFYNNDTSWLKNDNTESNMDDPKVTESIQFLADLIPKYKVSPQPAGFDRTGNFLAGHLVMVLAGRATVPAMQQAEFTDFNFTYHPHKAGPLRTVVGAGGWAIATMTPHVEESWEVINLLNCFELQRKFIELRGSNVSRKSVMQLPEVQTGPPGVNMNLFYEALDHAEVVPAPPNFNVVDALMRRWYAKLWAGEITVDELVKGVDEELKAEMEKITA